MQASQQAAKQPNILPRAGRPVAHNPVLVELDAARAGVGADDLHDAAGHLLRDELELLLQLLCLQGVVRAQASGTALALHQLSALEQRWSEACSRLLGVKHKRREHSSMQGAVHSAHLLLPPLDLLG